MPGANKQSLWIIGVASAMTAWSPLSLNADAIERAAADTLTLPDEIVFTPFSAAENAFGTMRFDAPIAIANAPGEDDRVFVVERGGTIRAVTSSQSGYDSSLFFRIPQSLNVSGEGGALGLAFHPEFQTNGKFYVFYTLNTQTDAGSGFHTRVSQFSVREDDPSRGDPDSEVVLFTQYNQATNHNGGDLSFGPDGYLYIASGDEGQANDNLNNSQRIDKDLFSGILRIDVDNRPNSLPPNPHPAVSGNYSIPPDNPFVGATEFNGSPVDPNDVRTEFWAVGLRNPWRFSFDSLTGDLYVGDVGQGQWEEISQIIRGGNYGWNAFEGTHRFRSRTIENHVEPIYEYPHSERPGYSSDFTGVSVTGGVVYRGVSYPGLRGNYLFTDFSKGNIWGLRPAGPRTPVTATLIANDATSGIVGFGIDPVQGDVLLADLTDGVVRRLTANETAPNEFPTRLSETGAFSDLETLTPHPGIVPYEINTPFWSDKALKSRWFALRDDRERFRFEVSEPWEIPDGAVWIKHFEMDMVEGDPSTRRRLETRFLVKTTESVYGVTYKWNEAQTDATLVSPSGETETLSITNNEGETVERDWRYPSQSQCLQCHTSVGGWALGFNTAQLNRPMTYPSGTENQLQALSDARYIRTSRINQPMPRMVNIHDTSEPISLRVRSYLASNCAQCHQPNGPTRSDWDARFSTPMLDKGLVLAETQSPDDPAGALLVTPGEPETSDLLARMTHRGPNSMPPLATDIVDTDGVALFREWIQTTLNGFVPLENTFETWASTELADAENPEADDDNDNDGLTNYREFLDDRDPNDPSDGLRLDIHPVEQGFELSFHQWKRRGIELRIEAASSIRDEWRVVDENRDEWFRDANEPFGAEARTLIEPSDRAQFFRLHVIGP